jgi:hypothetical protein
MTIPVGFRLGLFVALVQPLCCAPFLRAVEPSPSQREIVRRAAAQRPDDPWPRGLAHVVLAIPGSQQQEKSYHEPGGSFSPAVGSFGVSIWVRDAAGELKTTSDTLPIEQIQQRFSWPDPKGVPAVVTTTPHYQATWSCPAAGTTTLELRRRGEAAPRLELAVRSVGPAGGPIEKIAWGDGQLRVNDRWTLSVEPKPAAVGVGHEGDPGWKSQRQSSRPWSGKDGWGFARIELAAEPLVRVTLRDSASARPNPLVYPAVRSTLELDLPDARFADCLNAQVAHLMMGLLDCRTPPGEPTNYPLAWQRDGAAVVAGLARAGQLEVARQLARYFAENDFFGGFGAEGDAPGQGLRVLEDVAGRLHDPAFDRWLWPHAKRKAAIILKMLSTDKPLRAAYSGPIVPVHRQRNDLDLVCEPAQGGRIMGRMDFCRPASYITAVSCQGLRGAASLARRLNHGQEAERWQAAAERLQRAWLDQPQWNESRTYISAIWPTWVAAADKSSFRRHLLGNSNPRSYEPWTYFAAAMTHQWVLLNEPDRVWQNLEWFWKEQTSPGLYTWWEGTGEENTFHLWEDVRGWTRPPYVTPHYWTAGEILALQVEMLAYVDPSGPEPVLVIGAGVPRSWLTRPLAVRGLPTCLGTVDWTWTGSRLQTAVHGRRPTIRAAEVFDAH